MIFAVVTLIIINHRSIIYRQFMECCFNRYYNQIDKI